MEKHFDKFYTMNYDSTSDEVRVDDVLQLALFATTLEITEQSQQMNVVYDNKNDKLLDAPEYSYMYALEDYYKNNTNDYKDNLTN